MSKKFGRFQRLNIYISIAGVVILIIVTYMLAG